MVAVFLLQIKFVNLNDCGLSTAGEVVNINGCGLSTAGEVCES